MKQDHQDIVVVGGGMAGTFAALGAKRRAERVLLIEQNASLGGQGTVTGERGFCGDFLHVNDPFEEILSDLKRFGALGPIKPTSGGVTFNGEILAFLLQEKLLAAGVEVLFHTTLVGADQADGRVTGMKVFNKSGLQTVTADYVIDCSGDGDLAAMAGFPTDKGGIPRNPDGTLEPDLKLQLPMSLCFWMEDTGERVDPILPPRCPMWNDDEEIPMTTVRPVTPHSIFVKMKVIEGDSTSGESYSGAEIRAKRQMMGLVYHLQTKGYRGKVYDTYQLSHVSPGLGVREGRRIVGEYVLAEADVRSGRTFEDAVAVGTYQIDYHWPHILQRAGTGITPIVPPYHIPLRSLIPKGGRNIAVAGRCASGDQMAMASFRVMTSCAQTGLAAGMACGLAHEGGIDLTDVDARDVQRDVMSAGQDLNTTPYRRYRRDRRKRGELVLEDGGFEISGRSTVLELENNETIVAFCGRMNGSPDTGIWVARRSMESWNQPIEVLGGSDLLGRSPVLYRDGSGAVQLLHHLGTGSSGSPRYIASEDGGRSWGAPRVLSEDLRNVSIVNRPIALENGNWIAPCSADLLDGGGIFVIISTDSGRTWSRGGTVPFRSENLPDGDLLHAAVWESGAGKVGILFFGTDGRIYRSDSVDGGSTWCEASVTILSGATTGIDLVRIDEGLVMAYGAHEEGSALTLALSEDGGDSWQFRRPVREMVPDLGRGFSYPSLTPSPEGVSLSCTGGRDSLAFFRFSVEHIRGDDR
jgi:hypothetical protein